MSNVGMCITLVLGLLTGCAQWASDSHDHAAEADGDLKAVRASAHVTSAGRSKTHRCDPSMW